MIARMDYPDKRDRKEIVLSSSSESATGAERKEVWNFSFDRVCIDPLLPKLCLMELLSRSSNQCRHKRKFLKKSLSWRKVVLMDIMFVSLPTGKLFKVVLL